ncbi:hypothetical protein HT665_03390 [Ursidibacter maritimus]|uniref:Lipoprotein n=1 Tax=Ursidibacter maritimus TaxID=1331689 RepID=A0A949T1A1_9PAST|nr:hypothetical protein [Ursidibacter maritimus]KAE9538290.1 hypothetical protein A1D26_06785 [Ursidibacter maritimus]MBV6524915.1 hypothetical protein [Ursidibacter maritimus]MBV6525567.1 hypothetical protein [Ursidibacter maritimus]MBV6527653.1 hypothetical protein [Ursidibacter maritimus]MBV6529740.1 hypothetical protein [Ursidibacter maritimus]
MKKLLLSALVLLSACSTPSQQSSVPLDMKAVQEYQHKIRTGNTVSPTAKEDNKDLNHSDRAVKVRVYPQRMVYPMPIMVF